MESIYIDKKLQKLKICVLGTGSFGTSLGTAAARCGHDVVILGRHKEVIDEINNKHTNSRYFSNEIILPLNLRASDCFDELKDCNLVIHAIPLQVSVEQLQKIKHLLPDGITYIIGSKGMLLNEKKFLSQVWDNLIPPERNIKHAILSGPSFAIEIMKGFPTLVTLGCKDIETAKFIQRELSNEIFRIYITNDVIGVEIGGALKNVIAITAGYIEGLGYRYNSLSACITRGVFEISLFSKFFGGCAETLNGLSGIGDIMLSALGDLSRNKKVGIALAKGDTIEEIIQRNLEVAEGVPTLKALHDLIVENNLNMPLCNVTYKVVYEKYPTDLAKKDLMLRHFEMETELNLFEKKD